MKKIVIGVISLFAGVIGGTAGTKKMMQKKLDTATQYADKHLDLFLMMNQWVKVKQEGKNLASYFEKKSLKKIAVYGMSYAGETLVAELKNTEIKIAYGIDKNADNIYSSISVVSANDTLEDVDAIVVTAISFYDEIKDMLSVKTDCPIISLEDILYEM